MQSSFPIRAARVVLPAAVLSFAVALHAQSAPNGGSCFPPCRTGFVCAKGACVSACNPPCAAGETCTSAGECVNKSAGAPSAAPTTTAAPVATPAPVSTATSAPPPPPVTYAPAPTAAPAATTATTATAPTTSGAVESTPPSPPTETTSNAAPGVHLHDGFYFRGGLGVGFLTSSTVTPPGNGQPDVDVSGAGPAVELAFGGAVTPGVVLGGGIYGLSVASPTYSALGISTDGGAAIASSIGPFIDWYPDATRGFHVEAALGLAVITAAKGSGTPQYPPNDESGNGFMMMGGIGYEWWIGDQLSLGVLGRVQYMSGSVKASGDTDSTSVKLFIPAILGTITYQ